MKQTQPCLISDHSQTVLSSEKQNVRLALSVLDYVYGHVNWKRLFTYLLMCMGMSTENDYSLISYLWIKLLQWVMGKWSLIYSISHRLHLETARLRWRSVLFCLIDWKQNQFCLQIIQACPGPQKLFRLSFVLLSFLFFFRFCAFSMPEFVLNPYSYWNTLLYVFSPNIYKSVSLSWQGFYHINLELSYFLECLDLFVVSVPDWA